jgi:hypothetical protein
MAIPSKNAALGFTLVAVGAGLSMAGLAVLAPICYSWSRSIAETAYRRGKENVLVGMDEAANRLKRVADAAQGPLGDAAKAARHTTALAAGALEAAARHVRETIE